MAEDMSAKPLVNASDTPTLGLEANPMQKGLFWYLGFKDAQWGFSKEPPRTSNPDDKINFSIGYDEGAARRDGNLSR